MKHLFLLSILNCFFSTCGFTQSLPIKKPQPTAQISNIESSNTKEESFECVRSTPESVLKKKYFVASNFTLKKNKEFPFQMLGFETAEFKNGDKLFIENIGCENYTLVFRFETSRFSAKTNNIKLWYQIIFQLIESTNKGLNDETSLVKNGTKALASYFRKNKKPKFDEQIFFGGSEIKSYVSLRKPIKLKENRFKIEVVYGIGPL